MEIHRIGRRVKAFRKLKGYTQVEFAKKLNISLSFLGAVERGTRRVSDDFLQQIADTLNIDKDELIGMREQ